MFSLHEGSPHVVWLGRSIRSIVAKPEISQPLLRGDSDVDARGALIYGSVIHDAGIFRMWYYARPDESSSDDGAMVAYAESDDGLHWRKPDLRLVSFNGDARNNLTNLLLHSATVFRDPGAPSSHRYRATGYSRPSYWPSGKPVTLPEPGYYAAHSSDGLHWEYSSPKPLWPHGDVITSCWDEFHDCGYVAMKRMVLSGGMSRRSIANAVFRGGDYSPPHTALIPDDYDDLRARESGGVAGDYYGMGWVPAPDMTLGLLWNFRMDAPLTHGSLDKFAPAGLYGQVDLSIIWRETPQSVWRHLPGRPIFVTAGNPDTWYSGGIYTASQSLRVGDEEWMYFCGSALRHGEYLDADWKTDESRFGKTKALGGHAIGVLRWKAGRLLGLHAPLYDTVDVFLPDESAGKHLYLNMRTWGNGVIRAELLKLDSYEAIKGWTLKESLPLHGDDIRRAVVWKKASTLPDVPNEKLVLRLHLDRAAVYGFEVKAEQETS